MAKKLKPEATRKKEAKKEGVKEMEKKPRAKHGPRKAVLVAVDGGHERLQDYCKRVGLVQSTIYNRIKQLFTDSSATAMVLPADHPVFSAEKSKNTSNCTAIMANGTVVKCRVNEIMGQDYQLIITKRGFMLPGDDALQEFLSIQDYKDTVEATKSVETVDTTVAEQSAE